MFEFQTWLAGPYDCGEARCPIPFNSELFVEGTYTSESGGNDLCFMVPHNNKTLKLHGLCAIPVAMVPRTPLPPVDSCPKLRVSIQGVKSLGGRFACLCHGFEFYEVKKKFCYYFSKRKWKYFYTYFYIENSSKRAKQHKPTTMTANLLE